MIKYYQQLKINKKIHEVNRYSKNTWVHLESPTEEELKYISEKLRLNEGHLKDAIDIYEVPRLEVEKNALYLYTRYPYGEGARISTSPITFIMNDNMLATISLVPLYFMEPYFSGKKKTTTQDKSRLFLQISMQINSAYNYFLTRMSKQIRSTGVQLQKLTNEDIVRFVTYEEILNDFKPILMRNSVMYESFLNPKQTLLKTLDVEQLEDVSLYNRQLIELVDDSIKTISNVRGAYTTIMTNNLNRTIKLLTSLTAILTIPTMIASIYGMNIALPLEYNPMAFILIMAFIIIITAITLIFFIKKDFL